MENLHGGIVPPPTDKNDVPVFLSNEVYFNKKQFFELGKVLGKSEEELEKEWNELECLN